MAADIVELADAIVMELGGATFGLPFSVQRSYLPAFDLEELASLQVSVVPRGLQSSLSDRKSTQWVATIDIAVQARLQTIDDSEIDELMGFVQEIVDFLDRRKPAAMTRSVWTGTQNEPLFSVEHLREQRVFTSLLTAHYRIVR